LPSRKLSGSPSPRDGHIKFDILTKIGLKIDISYWFSGSKRKILKLIYNKKYTFLFSSVLKTEIMRVPSSKNQKLGNPKQNNAEMGASKISKAKSI
jgi:hypothetical protein